MGRGDFFPGYYRGDPGIFGAIAHVIGGAALGFVTGGGPLGAIRGAIGGTVSGARAGMQPAILEAGGSTSAYTPALRASHAAAIARSVAAGAVPAAAGRASAGMIAAGATDGRARSYVATRHVASWVVRLPRRMNVLNVRALRRAERRARGFLRHSRRLVHYFVGKKPKGRPYIRARHRK